MAKTIVEFNKKNRGKKSGDKDGKALYKLMNIDVYGEAMENLRNGIHAKLVKNENNYLKWTK